ncbi:MAG: YbhB/YbcL family Raf kinase inhibitor-like protein [Chitinivibrionales bacterium]|nr:YbhB/YbcL family Raf kinase inhibitor-like protein [Chitinivibrionales bacterium]
MVLKSPAFTHKGMIPKKYTAEGENINPRLEIEEMPEGTQSLCLIACEPEKNQTHWAVYNVPVTGSIEEGRCEGIGVVNDFLTTEYIGPGPQQEEQHLLFQAFALDSPLTVPGGRSSRKIRAALQNHVIDSASLEARYRGTGASKES